MFTIWNFRPNPAIRQVRHRLSTYLNSMTMKARVVLLVVALFVGGVWVLALSLIFALERDLTQLLSASLSAEIVNVAGDLDRDVRLYVNVLTRLADSLTPEILANPVKLERALDQFADTSAIVPHACFVTNGQGIIAAGYPEHAVPVAGTSIRESEYFRELVAGGKPVIAAPGRDGKTGIVQGQPTLTIAVPLRNGAGVTIGALVGSVLLSDPMLLGQIDHLKLGQTGWFLVVSPKDRVILSATDRNRVLTSLPGHGVVPLLDRRFEEAYEGAGITVASIGTEVLSVGRKMETTGWMIIASNPTAEIFAPIASLKGRIYLVALLMSLAAAVVLRFFLARQFAPLSRAGAAMRRMTDGEIPMAAIAVTRHDEIGELIVSFNRLVAERNRFDQSLQAEIIKRKQANEALRESRDRIEGIYQSVGDGIVTIDAQQRVVLFNSAAERIFGYSVAEVAGQPLAILLPERFRREHEGHIRNFSLTGYATRAMGKSGLIFGMRKGGEEFPIEASVSQSGLAPDTLFTVVLRDITERRQTEKVREQLTRQLESLSQRLATAQEDERGKIAHELHEELGQELSALNFYLQARGAGGGKEAGTPNKEARATVAHATERVRKLVLDLEPPELTEFGLYSAVGAYCRLQAMAGGWKLHLDAPKPEVRPLRAVERACFRILQEGLSNIQSHAQASEVWVDLRQSAEKLELTIRDNGIGFDRNAVSGDRGLEGSGLGLFGMQIRAKSVGGTVEVKSKPGAGTELLAFFPLDIAAD